MFLKLINIYLKIQKNKQKTYLTGIMSVGEAIKRTLCDLFVSGQSKMKAYSDAEGRPFRISLR